MEATEGLGAGEGEGGASGRSRCRSEGDGLSRSIKLPQTMDVALRNIKDAKVISFIKHLI